MIAKLPVGLQTVGLLVQLRNTQALITRAVVVPFATFTPFALLALLALGQALKLDFLEAGFA
jgi:hypothetical protein